MTLGTNSQEQLQLNDNTIGYPVAIYGFKTTYGAYWQYTGGGSTWSVLVTNFNIGLYVQYTVSADGGYLLASDERIKTDIKEANRGALDVIRTIPIKSHSYIDKFINGCPTSYNVIAQDIQKIYPEAVSITDGFIPDMFVKCKWIHINDSEIEISIPKPHTVIVGDKVKCILEDSSFKEAIVSSITNDTTFRVKKWEEFKLKIGDELFVYGKLVNDFLRVDKIRLGVLALAGVKELTNIVEIQNHQIQEQQKQIKELQTTLELLKNTVDKLIQK
jgi:hypothetical protein